MRHILLLLGLLPFAASASDAIVGEWNIDAAACSETRITYTADGRHESLRRGDGGWETLASGTYSRDGERVTVEADGQAQTLEIVSVDDAQLVLRNPDPEKMAALGVEQVTLVRCPPR